MTLPIPTPSVIAQRFAAGLSQQIFTATDGTQVKLDATAPATLEQALSVLLALGDYETYLYARDIGIELMVTTATENGLLPQHAAIWGVPRMGATSAVGNFIVQSSANTNVTLQAGTLFTVDGTAQWSVIADTTIAPNATASVAVRAVASGTSGNLAPNTTAQLVSPVSGIQSVSSDQTGLTGGAPIEAVESWRTRIIDIIRNPPGGGTDQDYQRWARSAGAAYVSVAPQFLGRGTVAIFVAMSGGAQANDAQIQVIQDYIDTVRPVRANATVIPAQIVPQNPVIALNPDNAALREAVKTAMTAYYLSLGIGGKIYVQGIGGIIANAAGGTNDVLSPIVDIQLAANQMAVLGSIQWGSYA